MRIKLNYITPVLAAGAAAAAIAAAPIAAAGTAPAPAQKSCSTTASGSLCQSPGNAEITNTTPPVNFYPYGNMPFLLGGGGR